LVLSAAFSAAACSPLFAFACVPPEAANAWCYHPHSGVKIKVPVKKQPLRE
jgi:hypothetical protein